MKNAILFIFLLCCCASMSGTYTVVYFDRQKEAKEFIAKLKLKKVKMQVVWHKHEFVYEVRYREKTK